ncbi:sensor histidine kinase [Microbacterium sp. NPDC056044]|uniref:sensor histidine kinase n=1 Tax=Microbacterium sp. NPDC056044 TaxID=3345690 RepID=UPI0035D55406
MSRPATAAAAVRGPIRRRMTLSRGIAATWWYTVVGVLFLEFMVVFAWTVTLLGTGGDATPSLVAGIGGIVWWLSTVPLLLEYRHRVEGAPLARWSRTVGSLIVAAVFGLVMGLASGLWLLAVIPLAQSLVLLNWPPGVRLRVVLAVTLLLGVLWFVDTRAAASGGPGWWLMGFFITTLPLMSVLSLWWWDVLITVDRARASEARLAATQERLRVATDVHDLQGHHLQVIALQLELAERLMPRDPDAALEQLRAARASVDEARQGTRDLATRVRSVPLPDELANAADLLRAAGLAVELAVDPDAGRAPASVLAPIIRETTTNVLRHGRGGWARLALVRDAQGWRYEIANDAGAAEPRRDASGLQGMARRVAEAGGTLDAHVHEGAFVVVVRVPAGGEASR